MCNNFEGVAMKIQHPPSHWALVALVLLALLLTLSEAHGQSGAATAFAGRPVMGGANGGQGAMAGLPQGGIGVQGTEAAERSLRLSKPSQLDEMRAAKREGTDMVAAGDANHQAQLEIRNDVGKDKGKEMAAPRDTSVAKEQRSASRKIAKSAKKTVKQARHGVAEFDTTAQAAGGPKP
jgi:hypothetical protein